MAGVTPWTLQSTWPAVPSKINWIIDFRKSMISYCRPEAAIHASGID
jgi:hypothetical protein